MPCQLLGALKQILGIFDYSRSGNLPALHCEGVGGQVNAYITDDHANIVKVLSRQDAWKNFTND